MTAVPRLVPHATIDPATTAELRTEVRQFIAEQLAAGSFTPTVDAWLSGWDENFTAALAARGWLGMTVPVEYGGHGRSFVERFVVTEELLAAGAPVVRALDRRPADRAVAAQVRHGTAEVRVSAADRARRVLFRHRHERAGLRVRPGQRAHPGRPVPTVAGRLSGTKVWTSGAHCAHAFIVLARTAPVDPEHRHAGLSQFIVNLRGPGIEIRPIVSMNGAHHFNEVILEQAFVPDTMVFGEIGDGWRQVTSELSFERSGPERFLSTFVLLAACRELMASDRLPGDADLGRLVARVAGLHQMSSAVAGALERADPALEVGVPAAVVKVLGTTTEGDIADFADLLGSNDSRFRDLVSAALDQRPGFTLRGGTNEVLRGVIARELGLR